MAFRTLLIPKDINQTTRHKNFLERTTSIYQCAIQEEVSHRLCTYISNLICQTAYLQQSDIACSLTCPQWFLLLSPSSQLENLKSIGQKSVSQKYTLQKKKPSNYQVYDDIKICSCENIIFRPMLSQSMLRTFSSKYYSFSMDHQCRRS